MCYENGLHLPHTDIVFYSYLNNTYLFCSTNFNLFLEQIALYPIFSL